MQRIVRRLRKQTTRPAMEPPEALFASRGNARHRIARRTAAKRVRSFQMRTILLLVALLCAVSPAHSSDDVILAPGAPWKRHTIDNTSRGADGVKLGDLNRDGLPDLVTAWEEGGVVRAYLNPGPARAREPWPQVSIGEVKDGEDAIFADLDGDGRLEVISGTEGRTRTLFRHRFTGAEGELLQRERWQTEAFPVTTNAQMWMQAVPLDVDGRHGIDLVVASKNTSAAIGWLQSPAHPNDLAAWSYHRLRAAGWLMSLSPHDADRDGDLDLIFTDRKGARSGVFWLENPGTQRNQKHAEWPEHLIGAAGREVMFADVGDLNGDGRPDVVAAAKPVDVFLWLRQADGAWEERALHLDGTSLGDAKAVKIADVNGDGLPDLLFTCENAKHEREGIVWLEQTRGGPWQQHTLGGPEGVKYDLMQTLDLDGDGDLDVITCEERDQLGVIWYENPSR